MTEQNNQLDKQKKQEKNKRMLLWGILIIVIVIIGCVLMGDECKMYRLNSESRNALPSVSLDSDASTSFTSYVPASSALSVNDSSASEVRKELANLFKSYA
jgi:hypothetical protein